ncbi:MAG: hypothetical protein GY866_25480 [Proteobacteria bacterium]|nr:hypothetical protein [Pseudomonadota bacterium]
MDELKDLLKTRSRMTVFRKLKKLDYISSCSHRGKYYSLSELAEYDEHGVWLYESVTFSKHGTIGKTLEHLIDNSPKGCSAYELYSILKVKVEDSLLVLVKKGGATRKKTSGCYVYYSKAPNLAKKQELTRKGGLRPLDTERASIGISTDELEAALIIFLSTLNEKQRRFYAGFESLKVGRGGDELIAELLDLNPKTVARGRRELLGGKADVDTIREKGGGRKRIKKKSRT